ncbi:MAG: hypothetical protein AB8G22_03730 [Saprospiraceae bacterium]
MLSYTACEEDTTPQLNKADIDIIDTLYMNELKSFRPYLDSICEAQFDSLVQLAADSMLIERMEEVERQRSRYQLD